MRGSSLVELLCSISLLFVLLISGFNAIDFQSKLSQFLLQRTRPEQESNYRLLVMRTYFHESANRLESDPLLAEAPVCFPDLEFGNNPRSDAFSLIDVLNDPAPFRKEGSFHYVPLTAGVELSGFVELAGSDSAGNYGWNFARIQQITDLADAKQLQLQLINETPDLIQGSAALVAIHGFAFANQTLYWISPAGQSQPFLNNIDQFNYRIQGSEIEVSWRKSKIAASFEVNP